MSRMTDQIGRVLSGRYRLVAPLGTGASAQVYLADDVRLRRRVAVKLLHAALADDETFLRRFRAEAQSAAALSHPNIVAVFDWGDDDGTPFIVTEYLSGGSLRAVLDEGDRLSPSQALLVGLETGRALEYAHRRGFVHRDIKPANLLFGDDGRLRIADFGLARALAEAAWTEPQGAVLGTARYASPEQAQGESVDGRADVYSLCLVLVEAVTGTVPFTADTTIATLMARVGKPVPVPTELGPLAKPLERAGQPDPADRPDAGELVVSLMASAEALPRPEPIRLLTAPPEIAEPVPDGDATMLGTAAAAPGADAGLTRLAEPGDETVVDGPVVAAPDRAPVFVDVEPGRDGPYDDPSDRRRWPVVLVALVLAALLGVGAAWAVTELRPPRYEVPTLVSLTEAQALAAIEGNGWNVDRREDRLDGSEPGRVLRIDPEKGELLEEGGTLVMWVSLGNSLAPVPTDLVGKTMEEAQVALTAAGDFVAKAEVEQFSEDVPAGVVMAVAPESSGDQPKGGEILLTVSKGPQPRIVPSGLAGRTYDEAVAALAEVQLEATRVEAFSDDVEAGFIVELRPGEGQPAARDSAVEVVISKGPDLVAVPKVGGLSLDQAIASLERAGLVAGDVFGPARGRPFETSPRSGTQVRRGASVDIHLSR